jgi:hypothetical protein
MKKLTMSIITTLLVVAFWACRDTNLLSESLQRESVTTQKDGFRVSSESEKLYEQYQHDFEIAAKFREHYAPEIEHLEIDAETGTTKESIITKNGTQYKIPTEAFVDRNGNAVSGRVQISIQEIFKPSDMLLANKPTVTEKGELLQSFGEMRLDAFQNGEALALEKNKTIEVIINPEKAELDADLRNKENLDDSPQQGIPIWVGDTTVTYYGSGINCNVDNVAISYQITQRLFKWTLDTTVQPAVVNPSNTNGVSSPQISFNMNKICNWVNVDRLSSIPGARITVTGVFNNHYNIATNSRAYADQPTGLYFKPHGYNMLTGLYQTLTNDPVNNSGNGFYSYIDQMPEGLTGTFLAYSVVNGQFYMDMQSGVTLQHNHVNTRGGKVMKLQFDPHPVSETDLLNAIQQLNSL